MHLHKLTTISSMARNSISIARSRLSLTNQHLAANRLTTNRCLSSASSPPVATEIININQGTKYTPDYKNYAVNKSTGKILSYFHDIPLDLNHETKEANMVVEIPRWSNAKFEIDTKSQGNPIKQDIKKGEVRFVKNLFPHHGYIHNYGALSQTWEDVTDKNAELNLFGDNDPLDVCEIGSEILATGSIVRVKILGSIALIDDGELDWKVIAINVNDPLAQELFDIHDLYVKCPGLLETTRQWFKDYKVPDNKPENDFAFSGVYKDQKETMEIVSKCNGSWKKLVNCEVKGENLPVIENSTLVDSPGYIGDFNKFKLLNNDYKGEAEIPLEVDKSHFVSN